MYRVRVEETSEIAKSNHHHHNRHHYCKPQSTALFSAPTALNLNVSLLWIGLACLETHRFSPRPFQAGREAVLNRVRVGSYVEKGIDTHDLVFRDLRPLHLVLAGSREAGAPELLLPASKNISQGLSGGLFWCYLHAKPQMDTEV